MMKKTFSLQYESINALKLIFLYRLWISNQNSAVNQLDGNKSNKDSVSNAFTNDLYIEILTKQNQENCLLIKY